MADTLFANIGTTVLGVGTVSFLFHLTMLNL